MSKTMADVGREGLNRSSLNRSKSAILFGGNMKKCSTCKELKPTGQFNKNRSAKDGLAFECKGCQKRWRKEHPFHKTCQGMRYRCKHNKTYIRKGIKCLITPQEVEKLWNRDKGWLLKYPSIDRRDNSGDYIYDNCQFIELVENTLKDVSHTPTWFYKPVNQYTLDRKFIKRFKNVKSAAIEIGGSASNISNAASEYVDRRGWKHWMAYGFLWRYDHNALEHIAQKLEGKG